jgi:hypothetical protein
MEVVSDPDDLSNDSNRLAALRYPDQPPALTGARSRDQGAQVFTAQHLDESRVVRLVRILTADEEESGLLLLIQ